MKLSLAQIEKTVNQLQIQAIPDDHPLVPQLNQMFGEHSYFWINTASILSNPLPAMVRRQRTRAVWVWW